MENLSIMSKKKSLNLFKIRVLSIVLIGILISIFIVLAFQVPVYTDAIAFKSISSRLFIDDFNIMAWSPQCNNTLVFDLPYIFYFQKVVDSVLFYKLWSPLQLRMSAIICFMLSMFIIMRYLKYWNGYSANTFVSKLASISLFFWGVLPWLMIMNRPEQKFVFLSIVSITMGLYSYKNQLKGRLENLLWSVSLLIPLYTVPVHPKSMFLFPIFLMTNLLCSKDSSYKKYLGLGLISYIYVVSYHYYSTSICHNAPILQAWMSSVSYTPADVVRWDLHTLLSRLKYTFNYLPYVQNIFIQPEYQANWFLGATDSTILDLILNKIFLLGTRVINYIIFGSIFLRSFAMLKNRRIDVSLLYGICVYLSFFATTFFIVSTNFYESAIRIPFIFITLLLIFPSKQVSKYKRFIYTGSLAIIIFSLVTIIRTDFLMVRNNSSKAHKQLRGTPETAASLCNIDLTKYPKGVVCDSATMVKLWHVIRYPIKVNDINEFFGRDIEDSEVFLKDIGSEGMIIRCDKIPKNIKIKNINRIGDYCCHSSFK